MAWVIEREEDNTGFMSQLANCFNLAMASKSSGSDKATVKTEPVLKMGIANSC